MKPNNWSSVWNLFHVASSD